MKILKNCDTKWNDEEKMVTLKKFLKMRTKNRQKKPEIQSEITIFFKNKMLIQWLYVRKYRSFFFRNPSRTQIETLSFTQKGCH